MSVKSEVPEHIRAAAREMNRKAFEERLRYDTFNFMIFHTLVIYSCKNACETLLQGDQDEPLRRRALRQVLLSGRKLQNVMAVATSESCKDDLG